MNALSLYEVNSEQNGNQELSWHGCWTRVSRERQRTEYQKSESTGERVAVLRLRVAIYLVYRHIPHSTTTVFGHSLKFLLSDCDRERGRRVDNQVADSI